MLDPYYRTIRGFMVLVEKEWMENGFKFKDRHSLGVRKHDEFSPIFIQFLDCVH